MTTPIEHVARAIYEKRNGAGCTPWSRLPKWHQEPYRGDARAAIDALVAEVQEEGAIDYDAVFNEVSRAYPKILKRLADDEE